ncbi:MAG: hypothetical protein Q7V05_13220 [Methanoregula sp.]|nr:hypothetical protein [Methanoregula sp.]
MGRLAIAGTRRAPDRAGTGDFGKSGDTGMGRAALEPEGELDISPE